MTPTRPGTALLLALATLALAASATQAAPKPDSLSFDLVAPATVATCLPDARGEVRISQHGENQMMDVKVSGLPPRNTFTVFVLQVPHGPFGMAWYQGDVKTDDQGNGRARFIGIFSDETFIVAPAVNPAPVLHTADANSNPVTAPVHMFHLGMWFDSTAEATAVGCPGGQTPFNGDHTAGIQILNTTNFADDDGPLGQFGN
ncbi:MAG TPA: hypothetical protein VE404_04520 [Verrucomicrobiae bacterium]|nr:hypothetical protein [Verrucomicrobiae bacterium]